MTITLIPQSVMMIRTHRSKKLEQTKLEEVVDRQKWDMTMYLGPSRQACAGDSVLVQEENLASPTTVGHLGSV